MSLTPCCFDDDDKCDDDDDGKGAGKILFVSGLGSNL